MYESAMHFSRPGLPLSRAYLRAFLGRNLPFGCPQKQKWLPGHAREPAKNQFDANALVCALREQGHHDHQVRKCKQPLIRADAGRFRCPRDEAQMAALCKIVYVLDAKSIPRVKEFYFCELVTVFGRAWAISRICFICRISCEAMNCSQSYAFKFPRNGCGKQ